MVFTGKDSILHGIGLGERIEQVYQNLLSRISSAVGVLCAGFELVLTEERPVEFSDGEYEFRKSSGILTIRVNRQLPPDERVRVFFRELAEFLQRCERGYCITREVWEFHAPMEYNTVMEALYARIGW